MGASYDPREVLPRRALDLLPATLCERWTRLRMGDGKATSSLDPKGPSLALWFAEACWWEEPVPDELLRSLYAQPELLQLVGYEALTRSLNLHERVDETFRALQACDTALADAHVLTARGYQSQATSPHDSMTNHKAALAIFDLEDPWCRAAACRSIGYLAFTRGDEEAEEHWANEALRLQSPLAADLLLAVRTAHKPERFELGNLAARLERTGPKRMASRVKIAEAFTIASERGMRAALPYIDALLEQDLLLPAQASIPRLTVALGALLTGNAAKARATLAEMEPNNAHQDAWKQMARGWVGKLEGEDGWSERLDPLARSIERGGAQPEGIEPLQGLLSVAPEEGPTLRGMIARLQHRWDLPGPVAVEPLVPLGGWEIDRPIAAGAQGSVWSARRRHTGEAAVVKWLPATARVWRRELGALARIDHRHVARVHDMLMVDEVASAQSGRQLKPGMVGLAMPRALGTLREYTPRPHQVVPVLAALLDALAHVHARGVVHFDVKEANVLVTDLNADHLGVWLSDFGTASAAWGSELESLGGTPAYMPPEQRSGNVALIGPPSDLYALGSMARNWVRGEEWDEWLAGLLSPDPRDRPSAGTALRTMPSAVLGFEPTRTALSATTWMFPLGEPVLAASAPETTPTPQTMQLPTALPAPAPSTHHSGWSGLLAWREPPWVARDALLQELWATLIEVEEQQVCRVVRLSGVGCGRRRLLRELIERATRTDAALARDVQLARSISVVDAVQLAVARTPLAPVLQQIAKADSPLEALAAATGRLGTTCLLTVGVNGSLSTAWLDAIDGAPGAALVVVEDDDGVPVPPMTVDQLTRLGVSLAGLLPEEARRLAVQRDGCPGWFVSTLGVLERSGRLRGELGERRIDGQWASDRMGTIRRQLQFTSDPVLAESTLEQLHQEQEVDPVGFELLLDEGLARMLNDTPLAMDRWYRSQEA